MLFASLVLLTGSSVLFPSYSAKFVPLNHEGHITVSFASYSDQVVGFSFIRMTNSFIFSPLLIENGKERPINCPETSGREIGIVAKLDDGTLLASEQPFDLDSSLFLLKKNGNRWRRSPADLSHKDLIAEVKKRNLLVSGQRTAQDEEMVKRFQTRYRLVLSDYTNYPVYCARLSSSVLLRCPVTAEDSEIPSFLLQSEFEVPYLTNGKESRELSSLFPNGSSFLFTNVEWVSKEGWILACVKKGTQPGLLWLFPTKNPAQRI